MFCNALYNMPCYVNWTNWNISAWGNDVFQIESISLFANLDQEWTLTGFHACSPLGGVCVWVCGGGVECSLLLKGLSCAYPLASTECSGLHSPFTPSCWGSKHLLVSPSSRCAAFFGFLSEVQLDPHLLTCTYIHRLKFLFHLCLTYRTILWRWWPRISHCYLFCCC